MTHLYEFARSAYNSKAPEALLLRAERLADGTRTFRLVEGEPPETSYGEDTCTGRYLKPLERDKHDMTSSQNDMITSPQALHGEVARCLAALRGQPGVPEQVWRELHEKIAAETFNLVVAGQFKRGKSSVINALLGVELLPVGVVPLTSVVTILSAGETTQVVVAFDDGRTESVPVERLAEYVTEKGNPGNAKAVREVHIRHPSPWLHGGVCLIDTPGIGSVYRHNTDVAYGFLPKADAVLFVLSVDQPLGEAEHGFLKEIAGYAARVFVLLNKIDLLSFGELRESVQFTVDALAELLGGPVRLFPVSAREALRSGTTGSAGRLRRSGFPAFAETLATFLMDEKGAALTAVAARQVARLAEQAQFNVGIEHKSLSMPLEELHRKLELFEEKKQETLRARRDYEVLIDSEAGRIVSEVVNADAETFQRQLTDRIDASLKRDRAKHGGGSTRQLHAALERLVTDEVRSACDEYRIAEDVKVAHAFDALCARFTNLINATIDELQRFAADLFAIPFRPVAAGSLWKFESNFFYKFWTEPPSMQTLASSAVLVLPRIFGEGLVRRRIERRAADLAEVHAGRLRYDLAQRLEQGTREFKAQIVENLEATIASIADAVRRGLDAGQATEREIERRAEDLLTARGTLDVVRSRIERVQGAVPDVFSFGGGVPARTRGTVHGAADSAKPGGIQGGAP